MIRYELCVSCKNLFRPIWLKNDLCNGCRNPELIIKTQVNSEN